MKFFNNYYRKLKDTQLKNKIKRAEHWIFIEALCDFLIAILIISMDLVKFNKVQFLHIYILIAGIVILFLLLFPIIIVLDGKLAKKQLKENKFKKIKKSNLKDFIKLEDDEIIQNIIKQCVDSVLIENVSGSTTRVINFYLNNEEIISKVIDTDKELWKTIDLK